jgi:hypothetical protein
MVSPRPGAIMVSPYFDIDGWDRYSVTRYN